MCALSAFIIKYVILAKICLRGKALAHGYRTLQHWHDWLNNQPLGSELLEVEERALSPLLNKQLGKHVLLIGTPRQAKLINASRLPIQTIISPFSNNSDNKNYIESDLHELPINTGSVDLVILPHTLQFIDRSRQLLNEACRIIKPEGLIVILGFNPFSFYGLRKLINNNKTMPWMGDFIDVYHVKNWLQLADFQVEQHVTCLFRPMLNNFNLYQKLHFLDYIGQKCFPKLGGVYIIIARAKMIPLTPIRLHWKQQLSSIRISSSITGYS